MAGIGRAPRGMVVSSNALAGGTAYTILRRGGNAVDAAIAASAVMCVAEPHRSGLGGDGCWMIHDPTEGGARAINATGPAAQLATIDYLGEKGYDATVPVRGPLSALTVPGAVDGWRLAHERWPGMEWSDLFEDALRYAREGVPAGRSLAGWIQEELDALKEHPSAGQLFLRRGEPREEGERVVLRGLAETLERIAQDGTREGFYEGDVAERICDALAAAGSPLRPEDFAAYEAEWTAPFSDNYRGNTLYELPPNSQGIAALQILKLMEGFDVARWGDDTADYYHAMAEATKLAFADRDAWVTDPKSVTLPISQLLDESYLAERRELIREDRAAEAEAVEAGVPFKASAFRTRRLKRAADGGEAEETEGGGTVPAVGFGAATCLCVIDDAGLAVSAVHSLNGVFGSMEVGGDTGVLLHNRGAAFRLDEDHPNRLEPGKRTFHTLMPAMMFRDHRPWLILGVTGGESQPQTQAAIVSRLLDFGQELQQAIDAPRWRVGGPGSIEPSGLMLESAVRDEVAEELERRGHPVHRPTERNEALGQAYAIRLDWRHGALEGGVDPRGEGLAVGY